MPVRERLRRASAAGALAVCSPGAAQAIPDAAAVQSFLADISDRRVSDDSGMTDWAGLFREHFDATPRLFWAPGRVNLIGDHVDYCGGTVLPMPIQFGTTVAVRSDEDGHGAQRSVRTTRNGSNFDAIGRRLCHAVHGAASSTAPLRFWRRRA